MNMFSMFDPATSMNFSLNWMNSMLAMFFIPSMYWLVPSRWNYFLIFVVQEMTKQFSLVLNLKKNLFNILLLISIFMMIVLNNVLGMFPYTFTSSSHLVFGISLSLSLWLSFMLYGWITNMNHMFSHLVPLGTPSVLILFMVMIETISNLMRILSLALRLAANIVAGHCMLEMLTSLCLTNYTCGVLLFLGQCSFTLFEFGVAFIQAYVFTMLIMMYSLEV